MKLRFIRFVALRYFKAKRRSKGVTSTVLSISGVAVGVMTLTSVLAVMNGFQLGFIESILSISSYHIQIKSIDRARLNNEQLELVAGLEGIESVVPFTEHQTIARGFFSNQRGCLIRGLPPDVADLDPGLINRLDIVEGIFNIELPNSIVLGAELARHIGITVGDPVSLLALTGSSFKGLNPEEQVFTVTGLFKSGYYEFDLGWAFVSINTAIENFEQGLEFGISYGIKIQNRFKDQIAVRRIKNILNDGEFKIGTWREYNRAFFGALLMEKILMMVLIGLIFIVVGFNIYHMLRRAVQERYEEIGVLKALGASSRAVQYIFVLEGLLIGILGGGLGMLLGLLISVNINQVFSAAEELTNGILFLIEGLVYPLVGSKVERFSLFSPAYFYISEVPSRVLLHEAFLINLFALFSSCIASLMASLKVSDIKPAQVIRYE